MRRVTIIAALLVAAVLLLPGAAVASHYLLEDLDFVSAEERVLFEKEGVRASEDLLEQVSTPSQRAALAKKTGVTRERLRVLGDQVDLLQIRGIGPSMVRLIQAAGVQHAQALSQQSAETLHAAVLEANAREAISSKTPAVEMLANWIRQAARVPVRIRRR